MTAPTKGPQSYFRSIEAKYGKPIEFWMQTLASHPELAHMEMVALLKTSYSLGHGHANALVAHFRAQSR